MVRKVRPTLPGDAVCHRVRLGDLGDDLVVSEHSDLEILRADYQLIVTVLVVVRHHQRGHVVSSHRPEGVVALVVKSLIMSVSPTVVTVC